MTLSDKPEHDSISKDKVSYFPETSVLNWNLGNAIIEYKMANDMSFIDICVQMKKDLSTLSSKRKEAKVAVDKLIADIETIISYLQSDMKTEGISAAGKLADIIKTIEQATLDSNFSLLTESIPDLLAQVTIDTDEITATAEKRNHMDDDDCQIIECKEPIQRKIQNNKPIFLKKNKKTYMFNPPTLVASVSINKPRLDTEDAERLKPLYYAKFADTPRVPGFESSDAEYESNMEDQTNNKCLKQVNVAFDFLKQSLVEPFEHLPMFLWTFKADSESTIDDLQAMELIKYILTDYHANCLKPQPIVPTNERTPFCEYVLPLFKYFSATTGLLSFLWCEKSSESNKQLMIYLPTSGTKLFDGIGTGVKDRVERILFECSGDYDTSHTQEDSLKLLECTGSCIQLEAMKYRSASMTTFKKRRILSLQSIGDKITLLSTKLENNGFSCVELRSAVVPRTWEDRIYWDVCVDQEQLTMQLQSEHVGLIEVKKIDQVRSMACLFDQQ